MKLRAPMPSLDGANWLGNEEITTEMLAGRPAFIHFWSVSCDLCKYGLDRVSMWADKYESDLNVIAVHMPRTENDMILPNVKMVVDYYKMDQPIVVDNDFLITDRFMNRYVPAYYLFDEKGLLRHYQAGGTALQMLEKRIQRVIEEYKR
jgi:thiol-disulfide isomerase/thioredoxin